MIRGADISNDGLYRYSLWRHWGDGARRVAFVMLNPSTADGETDDPTIRRCIGFAKREGYDGLEVLNLFAYRATNPKDLDGKSVGVLKGPANDWNWKRVLSVSEGLIVAWGSAGQAKAAPWLQIDLIHIAKTSGLTIQCLGTTKDGSPRHPLYVSKDQPLEDWKPHDRTQPTPA